MKTLVAIGCSHTAGAELYDELAHHPENKNLSFAKRIADHLGYNYLNLSSNGASNDYIFRTAIEFFTNNIDNINDYVFLIGWTSCYRAELHYTEEDDFETYALKEVDVRDKQYIPVVLNMSTKGIPDTRIKKLVDEYSDILVNKTLGMDKLANYAFSLQNLFEKFNVKYLMFNTINELASTPSNQATIKLLNTERYINPTEHTYTFYWHLYYRLNFTDLTKWGHHRKPAHDAWANYILEQTKHLLTD
jgi:hypothetical protein